MGLLAGLIFGVVIAALTVALEHYGPSFDQVRISLSGNGAIAAPEILVPLAIFWGWSWIANAYAGRSVFPMAAYTLGLFLGVTLIGPADASRDSSGAYGASPAGTERAGCKSASE